MEISPDGEKADKGRRDRYKGRDRRESEREKERERDSLTLLVERVREIERVKKRE